MPRALIADDSLLIRNAVSNLLELARYETVLAEDGQVALERFHEDAFDLIVVDIIMPGLDGIELTRAIRQSDAEVPILILTSSSNAHCVKEAEDAGATGYLLKPLDQKAFYEMLFKILPMPVRAMT